MLTLHQLGHQTSWNLGSFEEGIGDGLILSPVHYSMKNVKKLDSAIKNKSYFDPQFYVPDSQKKKLNTYFFFPEQITKGFTTKDYLAVVHESAQSCIDFQIENEFKSLIIPARYYDEMVTDYIGKQKAFSVEPFLSYLQKISYKNALFVTLPLTAGMIGDSRYREQLLNWITSYSEISGVYLLVNFNEPLKQICDFKKLTDYLSFVDNLTAAGLNVICGYCNTEVLLFSINSPFAVTIGAYENTRKFSIDKFLEDDSEVRGPAPRIYLPNLLNWIRFDTALEIKEDHPILWEKIYTPTKFSEDVFNRNARPHFTQPELYKHYFELVNKQLIEIDSINGIIGKINLLQRWITVANDFYSQLQSEGILFFDNNCKGEHLPIWNRVLQKLKN